MFDYADAKATADELIAEFGMAGVLRKLNYTGPKHNPTPAPPTDYPVTLVVDPDGWKVNEVDGTRIQRTDKKVLLARGNIPVPLSQDLQLLIGGIPHAIADFNPIAPAGVVVYWTVAARK